MESKAVNMSCFKLLLCHCKSKWKERSCHWCQSAPTTIEMRDHRQLLESSHSDLSSHLQIFFSPPPFTWWKQDRPGIHYVTILDRFGRESRWLEFRLWHLEDTNASWVLRTVRLLHPLIVLDTPSQIYTNNPCTCSTPSPEIILEASQSPNVALAFQAMCGMFYNSKITSLSCLLTYVYVFYNILTIWLGIEPLNNCHMGRLSRFSRQRPVEVRQGDWFVKTQVCYQLDCGPWGFRPPKIPLAQTTESIFRNLCNRWSGLPTWKSTTKLHNLAPATFGIR
jgi:hypothetical protein